MKVRVDKKRMGKWRDQVGPLKTSAGFWETRVLADQPIHATIPLSDWQDDGWRESVTLSLNVDEAEDLAQQLLERAEWIRSKVAQRGYVGYHAEASACQHQYARHDGTQLVCFFCKTPLGKVKTNAG